MVWHRLLAQRISPNKIRMEILSAKLCLTYLIHVTEGRKGKPMIKPFSFTFGFIGLAFSGLSLRYVER